MRRRMRWFWWGRLEGIWRSWLLSILLRRGLGNQWWRLWLAFAPAEKRMGHAGAIVSGGAGDALGKIAAFEAAGVHVALKPSDVGRLVLEALGGAKGIFDR